MCLQLSSSLSPPKYTMVLFGIDVYRAVLGNITGKRNAPGGSSIGHHLWLYDEHENVSTTRQNVKTNNRSTTHDVMWAIGRKHPSEVGVGVGIRELHLMWNFSDQIISNQTSTLSSLATTYNRLGHLSELGIAKEQTPLHFLSVLTIVNCTNNAINCCISRVRISKIKFITGVRRSTLILGTSLPHGFS